MKKNSLRKMHRPVGFTLTELLVTLAVVALLAGFAVAGGGKAMGAAKQAREMNSARQLVLAYSNHAADHDGVYMPAFLRGATVEFPNGDVGSGPEADRYPWRLAPYLNWEVEKTYMVNDAAKAIAHQDPASSGYRYTVSVSPALGINAYCVGGYYDHAGLLAPDDAATRVSQSDRPLVLFTSARTKAGQGNLAGSWFVRPPALGPMRWKSGAYDAKRPSLDYGNVDFRHGGKAVAAFTDGSVRLLTIDELRDMRLWAKNATSASYSVRLTP